MTRHSTTSFLFLLAFLILAAPLAARQGAVSGRQLPPGSPFAGSVPQGPPTTETLQLTVGDIIRRALEHNLGVLLSEQSISRAGGARWMALSQLLPNLSARLEESRHRNNLEAFGFSPSSFGIPRVVGPFNTFDARVFLSQSVFDLRATNETRAENHNVEAARHSYRSARDLVVLVAANAYLEALAADARAQSARAQLQTSQAIFQQAQDLRQSGIIAGIDVVRAEVRLNADRQRVTASQNDLEKARLQLARVVGLPIGQPFAVSAQLPNVPVPDMTVEQALAQAYKERPDYLAAQERVKAAEATRAAAASELLPSVHVNADYGALGLKASDTVGTFTLAGSVNIPIFQGGHTQGRIAQADADLRQRRAEAEDMRSQIYYDVRTAFLDLQATGEELQVATRSRELANQELMQARDRFAAGVANNLEVVQAQQSVTSSEEQYIDALLGFDVAKAVLARSLGDAEAAVQRILGPGNP
ncbi:MAG TPA: TolC family protein [Vicinamibacterales bacterium]